MQEDYLYSEIRRIFQQINRVEMEDINKLLSMLGKSIVSHPDVVKVVVSVQLKDSTTTTYDSEEDPEFFDKYFNFLGVE